MDRRRSDHVRAVLEDMLGARYEILDLHGHGGMGLVFCARARALEQLFAIKVENSDLLQRLQSLSAAARGRVRSGAGQGPRAKGHGEGRGSTAAPLNP